MDFRSQVASEQVQLTYCRSLSFYNLTLKNYLTLKTTGLDSHFYRLPEITWGSGGSRIHRAVPTPSWPPLATRWRHGGEPVAGDLNVLLSHIPDSFLLLR